MATNVLTIQSEKRGKKIDVNLKLAEKKSPGLVMGCDNILNPSALKARIRTSRYKMDCITQMRLRFWPLALCILRCHLKDRSPSLKISHKE